MHDLCNWAAVEVARPKKPPFPTPCPTPDLHVMRSEARSIGFSCGFIGSRFARRQRINYAQGCCCCWAVAGGGDWREEVGSIAHQSVKSALQSHSSNWVRVSRDVAPGVAASQSPFPSPSPPLWHLFLHQNAIKKSPKKIVANCSSYKNWKGNWPKRVSESRF